MEKPKNARNYFGEIMAKCWEMMDPNERPMFIQLEEIIGGKMELSVSSYYCNLNGPFKKLNEEKTKRPTTHFGPVKFLQFNYNHSNIEIFLSQLNSTNQLLFVITAATPILLKTIYYLGFYIIISKWYR